MVIDKCIDINFVYTHIYKITKRNRKRKRTKQGIIHLFICSTHADIALGAEDDRVNKRVKVPALT